jgi:hypothetical protein
MTYSGLTAGRSYSFAVYVHNGVGYGSPAASNTATLPVPASAPRSVTAQPGTSLGAAALSWLAPASDGGAAIDGYLVQAFDVTTSGVQFAGQQTTTCGPCTTSTYGGLIPSHSYVFNIYAHNIVGYSPVAASNTVALPTS